MKGYPCSRREAIRAVGATAAGLWLSKSGFAFNVKAPTAPVAIGTCRTYGSDVLPTLQTVFDQLGGLDRLVKGKTVAIKLNLTGGADTRIDSMPLELTHWVHPEVIGATVVLLDRAGARRIRLLESPWSTTDPVEEFMRQAHWQPRDFSSITPKVEFENTNYLGNGKKYSRLMVPGGGLLFKGYDMNHSYEDCDVFVSLAKLKEHSAAGVTLSMKNSFGIIPVTIYGQGAGVDEPSLRPKGARAMLHDGSRLPSKSAPPAVSAKQSTDTGYLVPRVTADLAAARPIHLAVIDGIQAMTKGEGPWVPGSGKVVKPGLLIAGTNCVTTDAVCTAVMGFDPMADRGTAPFEKCDSHLRLAEELGLGTRDLRRIEVRGASISKVRLSYRNA